MVERDTLAAWLRLVETPDLGRVAARRLLAAFGSPQAVLAAAIGTAREVAGAAAASALAAAAKAPHDELVARSLAWLDDAGSESRHIVTLDDPRYPPQLLETADPPLLLYGQGRIELLLAPSLAVVGSRRPTRQGGLDARAFSATLSQAGLTIVSGLALGVDGAAHEGGLDGSASTIAVVGTGLDRVYPRRHLALAHRIAHEGLIVSEYALGTPPLPFQFPARNRIIAGLSRGTLVVEAALQSGSLITAQQAVEAGRDVFAIPGSIHSPLSRGCHALIKQGARLVDCADDILGELGWGGSAPPVPVGKASAAEPESDADPLLQALGFDPVTLDALVARTGWPAATLNTRLLELELDGQVTRLPGQLFQRIAQV